MPRSSPRFILAVEMAEKIAKGLCYYCDKPFERGHKCATKSTQLFLVEEPRLGEDYTQEKEPCSWENEEHEFEYQELQPQISVNALGGLQGYQSMRVTAYVGKKHIHMLIDSGSSHNFWDLGLAKKMGCKLDSIGAQAVTVALGRWWAVAVSILV